MFFLFFPHDTFSIIEALTKLVLVLTGSVLIICFCHKITHYKSRPRYKFDHTFGRINTTNTTTTTLANAQQHHQQCSTTVPLGSYATNIPLPIRLNGTFLADPALGDNRIVAETNPVHSQQPNNTFVGHTSPATDANTLAGLTYDPYNTIRPFGITASDINPSNTSSFHAPSASNPQQISPDNNTYSQSSLVTIHNSRFHPTLQTQLQPSLIARAVPEEQAITNQEPSPTSLECPSYEEAIGLISSTNDLSAGNQAGGANSANSADQNGPTGSEQDEEESGRNELQSSSGDQ